MSSPRQVRRDAEVTRYEVGRELGRGGMGVVWEAWDRLEGRAVALKQVKLERSAGSTWSSGLLDDGPASPTTESGGALALAGEFATLASLRHPHVVSVRDYGFDNDGQPFFTMELLDDAVPVDVFAERHPEQTPLLLAQLLEALRYLHRHEVLHRDLKPANALVQQTPDGPRLALLDFGLAVLRESASYAMAAGTPAYVAPEVASGSRPTVASDLYSFGVVAWDLLTGTHPYAADSTRLTLEAARAAGWRRSEPEGVPPGVVALLQELVALSPVSRPASVEDVLERWRAGFGLQASERSDIQRSFLQGARFVARQRELEQLTAALGQAVRGRGSCWVIEAESGAGKSRLVDAISIRARVRGATVLVGQASDARLLPFDLWRGVFPGLALVAGMEPLDARVLGALAPKLGTVLQTELEPPAELPAAAAFARLLASTERVFDRMGPPTLVVLEDLHQARPESLSLLERLARGMGERACLVLATARPGVAALDGVRKLPLGPLTPQELGVLGKAVLGPAGREPALIRALERLSEGNPFWAIEGVRACVDASGSVDVVDPAVLDEVADRDQLVARRIDRLDDEDREMLELAATLGRTVDPGLVEAGSGPWLQRLGEAAVLEVQRGQWAFAHDAVRQAVLRRLGPSRRRTLHREAAGRLRERSAPAAEVALHLAEAGLVTEAIPVQLQAAEEALRVGAAAEAETFAQQVLAAGQAVGLSPADRARAERCAVEASYAAGDLPLALSRVEAMRDALVGRTPLGRVVSRLGTVLSLLFRPSVGGGRDVWEPRLDAAESGFEAAEWAGRRDLAVDLLLLGFRSARALGLRGRLASYHAATAMVLAVTPLRRWTPTFWRWAEQSRSAGTLRTREEVLYSAAESLIALHTGRLGPARTAFERIQALTEQNGDRLHENLALRYLWLIEVLAHDRQAAVAHDESLRALARHDANPRVAGSARLTEGFEALFAGDFDRSRDLLGRALDTIEPTRERPTISALKGGLALAMLGQDDPEAAEWARSFGQELVDRRPTGICGMVGHLCGVLVLGVGPHQALGLEVAEVLASRFEVAGPLPDLVRGLRDPVALARAGDAARTLELPLLVGLVDGLQAEDSDPRWSESVWRGFRPVVTRIRAG